MLKLHAFYKKSTDIISTIVDRSTTILKISKYAFDTLLELI